MMSYITSKNGWVNAIPCGMEISITPSIGVSVFPADAGRDALPVLGMRGEPVALRHGFRCLRGRVAPARGSREGESEGCARAGGRSSGAVPVFRGGVHTAIVAAGGRNGPDGSYGVEIPYSDDRELHTASGLSGAGLYARDRLEHLSAFRTSVASSS